MLYLYISFFILILILGIYLKKRLSLTEKRSEGSILDMDCGGVVNGVNYTRPLIRLMVFEDRIVVKTPFSTVSINKAALLSIKPRNGFLAKGFIMKFIENDSEKGIIIWTDFISGKKQNEVVSLIAEKFIPEK